MCVAEGRLCDHHYLYRCNNLLRAYDTHHLTVCHANAVYRIRITLAHTYACLLASTIMPLLVKKLKQTFFPSI